MALELQDKAVLVVGLARSGVEAAKLALSRGARVTVTDIRVDSPNIPGASHVYGEHRRQDFLSADLIVVSPGVPASQPDLRAAVAAGVPVLGELAFAAALLPADLPMAAITGTNGKSSTTWNLGQLLTRAGRAPFVGGNLGTPLSVAVKGDYRSAAVEVSSYQLEFPGDLHPKAAAILNLTPDHLGRHGDMRGYADTKARIFARMGPGDLAMLPAGDPWLAPLASGIKADVLWLGAHPGVILGANTLTLAGTPDDGVMSLDGLRLVGEHNRLNTASAVLLAIGLGVPREALDLSALSSLAHRLELVCEGRGVRWVDDSKATNVDAAGVGIRGLGGPSLVLLGGQGKDGADYSALRTDLAAHARHTICFGASGPEMAAALDGLPLSLVPTLAEAVALAASLAQPGDAVLLSPAAASFDEFRDFEHRGEVFSSLAREVCR